jgi:acetyltransferase-like isoleucine patch superfamily enzyme
MDNIIEIIKENGEKIESSNDIKGLEVIFNGIGNRITVYENTNFVNSTINCGNHNIISIGKTSQCIKNLKILSYNAKNFEIHIGNDFSCVGCRIFTNSSGFVSIGDDCMMSSEITIWASDGHTVYDKDTLECINYDKPIIIGRHVWIGYGVALLKGTVIPADSIVASCSVVAKSFMENNIVIAGNPADIKKRNINWSRHSTEKYRRKYNSLPIQQISTLDKKTEEFGKDLFSISYSVFIENNLFGIKLNVKEDNDLYFEYHLQDLFMRVDRVLYAKEKYAAFQLKRFGKYRVRVFVKRHSSIKHDYSFTTRHIDYDEISAIQYLNYDKKDKYTEAKTQISQMIHNHKLHAKDIQNIIEKIQAISFLNFSIADYFKQQNIDKISVFGHQHDIELSKIIWLNIRYAKHFNIKYLLSYSRYSYTVFSPNETEIQHKEINQNITFDKDDTVLVCTLKKDEKLLDDIHEKTKAKVVHLLDILSEIYIDKFYI